jgi:CDP-diacylglycerol--glycerol-3-phosphate 3-phosphatidyltransferase
MRTDFAVLLGILGVALLSMPVYAVGSGRREPDPHEIEDRGSFVLGSFARNWFYWFVRPVERVMLALHVGPTLLNLAGVACGIVAGVLFAEGRVNLAGWAILLGGVADILDGRVARALGLANRRGAFLDSTLDRFAEVGAFVGLAVLLKGHTVPLILLMTALGGSLLVSYARARGESVGVDCKGGVMQRAERLLLLGFGAILDPAVAEWTGRTSGALLVVILALIAVGTVGTAVYRTVWIAQRLT